MEIYRTNNKDTFYTFIKIDNKEIELDFVLTVENAFYCDIFIKSKEDIKNKTYTTVEQYNLNKHNFVNSINELNKYITDRQICLIKKAIKKAYKEILKIKFEEIMGDYDSFSPYINEEKLALYEKYRVCIDYLY